jgi:hypothetical protein
VAEVPSTQATRSPQRERRVVLTIPARSDYLVLTRLALAAICRAAEFELTDVADLKLAVTEAAEAFMDEAPAAQRDALHIELSCPGGTGGRGLPELARAIITATVDEFDAGDDRLTLVKRLPAAGA